MSTAVTATNLIFAAPYEMALERVPLPPPAADQVLVQTQLSAISAGTELLFYRGQVPPSMAADATIAALSQTVQYPLAYGYTLVGTVQAVGSAVDPGWLGRQVFAFHPHTSHFLARPADLLALPADITPEQALFLPNLETAVNFVQDGAPLIGEQVVVLGQGVVGLLTTWLLAQFPLAALLAVDRLAERRARASHFGATATTAALTLDQLAHSGADLVYELTGNPAALNQAIAITGYDGRVVIGSWYGQKRAEIDLGSHFHRSRIRLISSQVSTIAPPYQGRWNKARRFALVWAMLRRLDPTALITQRVPLADAPQAYRSLDQQPEATLQVVLTYG